MVEKGEGMTFWDFSKFCWRFRCRQSAVSPSKWSSLHQSGRLTIAVVISPKHSHGDPFVHFNRYLSTWIPKLNYLAVLSDLYTLCLLFTHFSLLKASFSVYLITMAREAKHGSLQWHIPMITKFMDFLFWHRYIGGAVFWQKHLTCNFVVNKEQRRWMWPAYSVEEEKFLEDSQQQQQ